MIVNTLILLCFALALIFPLSYARSNWTKYLPGKALMFFSIIVAVVLGLGAWRALTGDFAPPWLRVGAYVGILFGLAFMDYALLREQSRDRAEVNRETRASADTLHKD